AGENMRIIAYFIVHRASSEDDQRHYANYGVVLEPETDCQFAPSVVDAYQGTGLGSRLMPLCQEIVHGQGYRRTLLWGRVYISNQQTVRFHEENDFQVVGRFNPGSGKEDRYDMLALLV
ncbi:MAG: GNAT family N-acetyltransferase, partial [Caldilineaceae bacterium]